MVNALSSDEKATIDAARAKALETAEKAFSDLDLDGNGRIDKDEAKKIATDQTKDGDASSAQQREQKINEFFETLDADKNGFIEKHEFLDFFTKLFDDVIAEGLEKNK